MKDRSTRESELVFDYETKIARLNQRLIFVEETNKKLTKELEESKEKYATLLAKHIEMMERCVGIIPKIRRPEE